MTIDKMLINSFVKTTQRAAYGASIFKGKKVNVVVEENSLLTRGETVVDWLGVTGRKANCYVIVDADAKKFFLSLLILL